jgi:NADH-quinone oxidoreductase subunit H
MKPHFGRAPLLLALALVWLVASGRSPMAVPSAEAVKVLDVRPRQVELGDRLVVLGEGFRQGAAARVTFDGMLLRPEEEAIRGTEIVLTGTAVSTEKILLAVDEATQALFCGVGDRAIHTTFEGSVEVAFAAPTPGTEPLAGRLATATLDVRPSAHPSDDARDQEGARFLAWIGLRAAPSVSGLVVEAVEGASRGSEAGIVTGDVVTRFDGVRVATPGDVVPRPGERDATASVRRRLAPDGIPVDEPQGGHWTEIERTISVDGFRRAAPTELLGAALILLASLMIVLFFAAPTRPMRSAALQSVVSTIAARLALLKHPVSTQAKIARALAAVAHEALPARGSAVVVDVVVFGLLASLPFGQYFVAATIDVGMLFVVAATALSVAALVSKGAGWTGVRAATAVAWQHVPAAIALACVIAATGSLRVQEIARGQGPWPWEWLAFRSPALLVAFVLFVGCMSIEPDVLSPAAQRDAGPATKAPFSVPAFLEDDRGVPHPKRGRWIDEACRAHRSLVAGLASAVFLGGWHLPSWLPSGREGQAVFELAGCAWFIAKAAGLIVVAAWVRWALPRRRLAERTRATGLCYAPLAAGAFLASAAWSWWSLTGAEQALVSGLIFVTAALASLALGARLRHGLVVPGGNGRLSSFL